MFAATLPSPLQAGEFKSDRTVTVQESVPGDLYVAAGTTSVSGAVAGDSTIAAGTVTVSGDTGGDLQVAAGEASLTGAVADDLRTATGSLHLTGAVSDDAVVAGGDLFLGGPGIGGDLRAAGGEIEVTTSVGGDARLVGGEIRITSDVQGDLFVRAERVRIDGKIQGDAQIVAETILIGPAAAFTGKVTYWSENEADFGQADAVRDESLHPELYEEGAEGADEDSAWLAFGVIGFFWSVFSGAFSIAVLILLFPAFIRDSAGALMQNTTETLGRGAIFILASPMAILLLFVTVLGIPVGGLWLAAYMFSLIFAPVILSAAFAAYLLGRQGGEYSTFALFGASVGVLVVLRLLSVIPFAGFLLGILWAMLAAGLVLGKLKQLRDA